MEIGIGQLSPTQPSPLSSPFETQDEVDPLLGLIDSHSGHGTFVCGIIQRVAPQAEIRMYRAADSDGFATDHDPVIKMTGVGLATAVLVDVTLVRLFMAPAALTLFGVVVLEVLR